MLTNRCGLAGPEPPLRLSEEPPPDLLDNPEYLRDQSARLRRSIKKLADGEIKRDLASLSLSLAQRAEAVTRRAEDYSIVRMDVERYWLKLSADLGEIKRRGGEILLAEAERVL